MWPWRYLCSWREKFWFTRRFHIYWKWMGIFVLQTSWQNDKNRGKENLFKLWIQRSFTNSSIFWRVSILRNSFWLWFSNQYDFQRFDHQFISKMIYHLLIDHLFEHLDLYCILVTSSKDEDLCQHYNHPNGDGPKYAYGSEINLNHNNILVAKIPRAVCDLWRIQTFHFNLIL